MSRNVSANRLPSSCENAGAEEFRGVVPTGGIAQELAYVTAKFTALAPFARVAELVSELPPIRGSAKTKLADLRRHELSLQAGEYRFGINQAEAKHSWGSNAHGSISPPQLDAMHRLAIQLLVDPQYKHYDPAPRIHLPARERSAGRSPRLHPQFSSASTRYLASR